MISRQIALSPVLVTLVFSVALEWRVADFRRVADAPRAVVAGLLPQFVLLPVATLRVMLMLDLPPPVQVAMILVTSCPGGVLANAITHLGGGNTALSANTPTSTSSTRSAWRWAHRAW